LKEVHDYMDKPLDVKKPLPLTLQTMPITKKSNIRSRWYRPNEKPLETGSKSTNDEPFGELSISGNEKLTDDLSGIKAPPPRKREEKQSRGSDNTHHNRNNRSRSQNGKSRPRDDESENKNRNKRHRSRPKSNHKRRSTDRDSKDSQNRDRSKHKTQSKGRPSSKPTETKSQKANKSKLSSFISKIFGS
jgi:hypothetical protein